MLSWVSKADTPDKNQPNQIDDDEVFSRMFKYNRPERCHIITAFIIAFINGAIFPFVAIPLAGMVQFMLDPTKDDFTTEARFNAILFIIFGAAGNIAHVLQ